MKLEIGQELEIEIMSITEKGDGMTTRDGMLLIVPGADIGQRVLVKVVEVGVTKAFCEVIDYIQEE